MKLSNCNISSCSCYHAMDVSSRYMSFKGRGHNKRVLDHHHHHHHLYSLSINTHTSLGKLYTGSYRILSRTARWNYCWWRSYSSTWSLWRWATIAWVFIIRISLANHLKIHLPATKPEQLQSYLELFEFAVQVNFSQCRQQTARQRCPSAGCPWCWKTTGVVQRTPV